MVIVHSYVSLPEGICLLFVYLLYLFVDVWFPEIPGTGTPATPGTATRGLRRAFTHLARHFAELPWISLRRGINNGGNMENGAVQTQGIIHVYYITIWYTWWVTPWQVD